MKTTSKTEKKKRNRIEVSAKSKETSLQELCNDWPDLKESFIREGFNELEPSLLIKKHVHCWPEGPNNNYFMIKVGATVSCKSESETWYAKCLAIISFDDPCTRQKESYIVINYYDTSKTEDKVDSDSFIGGNYFNLLKKVDMIPVDSIAEKVEMMPQLDKLNLSSSTPINCYRLSTRHFSIKHSLVRTANSYVVEDKKIAPIPPINYASPQDVILLWREIEDRGETASSPIEDSDIEDLECEGSDEEDMIEVEAVSVTSMWD